MKTTGSLQTSMAFLVAMREPYVYGVRPVAQTVGETHCPSAQCVFVEVGCNNAGCDWRGPLHKTLQYVIKCTYKLANSSPIDLSLTPTAPLQEDDQELEEIHQQIQRENSKTERYKIQIQETEIKIRRKSIIAA